MKRVLHALPRCGSLPEIDSIGVSVWDPIHAQREHVGPCWEVVHIIRGVVKLRMHGESFRGTPGDTLLIPAQTLHCDEFPLGTAFEVLHIMFTWKDAPVLFQHQVNRDLLCLPPTDKQSVRELAFDTYDCFKRQRLMWREMTRACLYRLLLFLWSAAGELRLPTPKNDVAAARERRRVMIKNAKEYIRANLGKPIMLADIAAYLGVSACHLSHVFSAESGFTLSSHLINARMKMVAKLLADPARRISEAAYAVGFEDPNYFSKAFRRYFGCSPEKFRGRVLRSR